MDTSLEITGLLDDWSKGDDRAEERLMTALLFEVDPLDPSVLAAAAAGFAAVALVANLVPAMRAVRVDPVVALSAEWLGVRGRLS